MAPPSRFERKSFPSKMGTLYTKLQGNGDGERHHWSVLLELNQGPLPVNGSALSLSWAEDAKVKICTEERSRYFHQAMEVTIAWTQIFKDQGTTLSKRSWWNGQDSNLHTLRDVFYRHAMIPVHHPLQDFLPWLCDLASSHPSSHRFGIPTKQWALRLSDIIIRSGIWPLLWLLFLCELSVHLLTWLVKYITFSCAIHFCHVKDHIWFGGAYVSWTRRGSLIRRPRAKPARHTPKISKNCKTSCACFYQRRMVHIHVQHKISQVLFVYMESFHNNSTTSS